VTAHRVTRTIGIAACAAGAFLLSVPVSYVLGSILFMLLLRDAAPLYALFQVFVPVAVALRIGQVLKRKWPPADAAPTGRRRRTLAIALAAGYALTAIVGIPATQNERTAWAIQEHDRINSHEGVDWDPDGLPRTETHAAFPLAPGLVLVFHDYTIGPTYGLVTWELYAWYVVGVRSLGIWPLSAS
jgi:hypothetical protein